MKTRVLAALTMAAGLVAAGYAMGADIDGKWSTDPQRKQLGGPGSTILQILTGPSTRGPRGRGIPIDNFPQNPNIRRAPRGTDVIFGPDLYGRGSFGGATTLTADLKVDEKKGTVRGSLKFRKPDSYSVQILYPIRPEVCGEFEVEDGVVTGDTFTFKTYVKFRNVRVPTQWKGRIESGLRMIVEPLEALPCSEQLTGGPGLGKDTATLTFHRAERGEGFQGKWWTRDPGAIGVIDLKTDGSGTVTGAFGNVCNEERRLAGPFSGTTFSMTTPASASGFGRAAWQGVLVGQDTLLVTAEPPPQCVIERPAPFVLLPVNGR